ncbi:MAG: hypothetical protein ACPIOQ_24450, partial [Promethearchaeia archaeon]
LWPARRRGRRGILGRARRQQEGPQLRATRLEPERAQGRALSGGARGGVRHARGMMCPPMTARTVWML